MIRGLSHPKIFSRSSKSSIIIEGDELVQRYLKILILSSVEELLADPNYGCNLSSLVFNLNNRALVDMVKDGIVKAVKTYFKEIVVTFESIEIVQVEDKISIRVFYTRSGKSIGSTISLEILRSELGGN